MKGNEGQLNYSPDGRQIVFLSHQNGETHLCVVDISTGDIKKYSTTEPLKPEPEWSMTSPTWSGTGDQIAYTAAKEAEQYIGILDLKTEQNRAIKIPGYKLSKPDWSPDDQFLVFNAKNEHSDDIYLYDFSTQNHKRLTKATGAERHFGFSPDGRYIGYTKRGGPHEDLFAISVHGNELINITNHDDHEWYPHWSPQSDKVLFYTTWGDDMTEVWTADFPGGELNQISNHVVEDFGSVFNHDGSKVIYISKRDGDNDLYVYDFITGETLRLNISDRLKEGWPVVSPDGKTLAYSSNSAKAYLYRYDLTEGSTHRVTNGTEDEEFPAVSPDGKHIAFVSAGEGSEANIMLYDIESERIKPFVNTYHNQTRPQFSPFGTLSFIQSMGGSLTTKDIFNLSLNKVDSVRLTDFGGVRHFIWSRDGNEVIYAHDTASNYNYDLRKLNIKTSEITRLTKTKASEVPTNISPNGQKLLYFSDEDGEFKIYEANLGDGLFQTTILGEGWDAVYSPSGDQIVFVSDNNSEKSVDLYVMDKNGKNLSRLTNDTYSEKSPIWATDGKSIIYSVKKGDHDISILSF